MNYCGTLFVGGVPVSLSEDSDLAARGIYGVTYLDGPAISIRTCKGGTPRERRALIHEILHVLDESYRLGLTHDQIRALATGLHTTLADKRNMVWLGY